MKLEALPSHRPKQTLNKLIYPIELAFKIEIVHIVC